MGDRGKKSGADLSVVANVVEIKRAPPPPGLSLLEVEEWRLLVNRMPADWFPKETHGLLKQYSRHMARATRLACLVNQMEESEEALDVDAYQKLLKSEEVQSRAIASLATRMRITQQSNHGQRKKPPKEGPFPWEFAEK